MEPEPPAGSDAEMARALAFERRIDEREATSIEDFPFGTAFFNEPFPRYHDGNFLEVQTRPAAGASAHDLIAEADRILGGAGLRHRRLWVPDGALGERLASGFAEEGYEVSRLVFMARHRGYDRPIDTTPASQVSWDEQRPAREADLRAQPWATEEEVVANLLGRRDATARATDLRFFAARAPDGEIASMCELYSDGETAEVEDVATLEAYRGAGLARAVCAAAIDTVVAEGHSLVFLVADDDDWPKHLYVKLGFDPIGYAYDFTLADVTQADGSGPSPAR